MGLPRFNLSLPILSLPAGSLFFLGIDTHLSFVIEAAWGSAISGDWMMTQKRESPVSSRSLDRKEPIIG